MNAKVTYQHGVSRKEEIGNQFGFVDVKAGEVSTVSLFLLSSSLHEKRSFYTLPLPTHESIMLY